MDNVMLTLKKKATRLGLCGKYKDMWNNAKTTDDIAHMALDANGVEFVCDGCAFKWGMTPQQLKEQLKGHINGQYKENVNAFNGYTSELYVLHEKDITVKSTLNTIISCKCNITVPSNKIAKIYITGNSNVDITCHGECYIYEYGENNVTTTGNTHTEKIDKSEWITRH